jgi:hypothetical protein
MKGIESLTNKERTELIDETIDCLYSRSWCEINGIDYINPDFNLATEKVYSEGYWKNNSN